ncbi:YesL family protein [Clostridium sp. AL.422]|uniref:YesL family protein n=1 Tax=Clostridium TaxID=1485 RepID=UPI00293E0064|nr:MULTISPECIES: YesL family protein [unclassified Clostridium]MDV4150872.1 YesL family protein [Clostridium sp. AL.422]
MIGYSDSNENKINKLLNYVHAFFLSSIYFGICNILFILPVYLLELNFYIIFISLVFLGPALVALCSFINKLIFDECFAVTKEFFRGYKNNFLSSLKVWIPLLIIASIIIFDLRLCLANGKFTLLIIPLTIMLIIDIILMSYSLVIISKYKIKTLDTLKLSLYLLIRNPFTSILNLAIIILCTFILINSKSIIAFFIVSIGCFLVIKNMKNLFFFIDNTYLK